MKNAAALGVLSLVLAVAGEQAPLASGDPIQQLSKKRQALTGRFLHITDIHPDTHYRTGATLSSGCHERPNKGGKNKGKGRAALDGDIWDEAEGEDLWDDKHDPKGGDDLAGRWGTGVSDCDSPMSLVNVTFDWLKKEWADEVDFVIWTGDNARHDIDRSLPRTPREIFNLNRMMVQKMQETFGKDVVIVPSIGNNDIYPHNVLAAGPNGVTSEFLRIWKNYIPSELGHVFERGAYFSVEVIPDTLAVISLNTLFWYDANTLVDGCRDHTNDPGSLELDWLEVQLDGFRERGMQVWMTGHVPPHLGVYFDNCYLRYGDLALRYQDTIVGHLFGHMNVDHFFFIDVDELEATDISPPGNKLAHPFSMLNTSSLPEAETSPLQGPLLRSSSRYQIMGRSGNNGLAAELKKDFGEMPGPEKLKLKDYIVVNVAPSVIPTYLPGIRVYSYNISGISREGRSESEWLSAGDSLAERPIVLDGEDEDDEEDEDLEIDQLEAEASDDDEDLDTLKRHRGHRHHRNKKHKKKSSCSRPENEDKPHCVFRRKPRYFNRTSPSRSNKPLTPLGYAQWYLPEIDTSGAKRPEWKLEYTTYKLANLLPGGLGGNGSRGEEGTTWDQPPPVPLRLLPGYDDAKAEEEEEASKGGQGGGDGGDKRAAFLKAMKKMTPWKMKDLSIPSYVKLARKLVAEKKLWSQFSDFLFVSSNPK